MNPGVLATPNPTTIGMRMPLTPQQQQQQRMLSQPGMMGSGQPMSGGFVNAISSLPNQQQSSWPMLPSGGGGGPIVGGLGLGMRMGGPGGPGGCR